jgi:hypothetical protein
MHQMPNQACHLCGKEDSNSVAQISVWISSLASALLSTSLINDASAMVSMNSLNKSEDASYSWVLSTSLVAFR